MGGVCCDWQIVRCDGRSLLAYKQQLLMVLRLTLHVVCKEVLTLSCMLLKHVLKAVTLTYASDYRSSTSDWDLPLSDVLPIRVLAFQYYTGCYRNIKPGFPRVLKSPEKWRKKNQALKILNLDIGPEKVLIFGHSGPEMMNSASTLVVMH